MPMLRNWILLGAVVLVFVVLHQSSSLPAIPLWPDQTGSDYGSDHSLVGYTYPQGSKAPKTSYPDGPEYSRMTSNISHYWQSPAYMALPEEFKALKHPRVNYDYKIYKDWNERSMREYYACLGAGKKCPAKQKKVVLCSAHWFDEAIVRGWRGGEGVWALSMHKAMRELGYTTLFSTSWAETLQQYQTFPDAVIAVIDHDIHECRKEKGCLKTAEQPKGIPAWKMFVFTDTNSLLTMPSFDMNFYPGERGPGSRYLDGPWTINADFKWMPGSEPWVDAQYIGYSLEHECGDFEPIPLAKRQKSAWFLAKVLSYAYQPQNPWDRDFWQRAKDEPSLEGLRFRGSYDKTSTFKWTPSMGEMVPLEAIDDVPKMNAIEFMEEIGNNVALVGMWHPWMSPSPYLALCVGTPFINPIIDWDESNPKDRSSWNAQEPRLRWMDPPYVYNVFKGDYEGFVHALKSAMTTPIGKYIVPEMTLDAVQKRVEHWLEADWYSMALEQRQQRVEDGEDIKWIM